MAKKRLEGKVAIVTGAGSGIGRAVALLFAEHGAKVVVNDYGGPPNEVGEQSSEPAERVVAEIQAMGGQAVANAGNVAEMATGEQMVQQAIDAFGQVDIAVCCAGILRERMVFNMTEAEWDDVVAVHLKGHFALTKYVSQVFRQQRSGRLIFISSNAMFGAPGQPNYAAAKGGVWSFMRSCANALGRYNVTCNAILPAASTRLMDRTPQAMKQRQEQGIVASEANAGTRRDPINVARWILYLASDEAQEVTGQAFGVRGYDVILYSHPHEKFLMRSDDDQAWDVDQLFQRAEAQMRPRLEDPNLGRGGDIGAYAVAVEGDARPGL